MRMHLLFSVLFTIVYSVSIELEGKFLQLKKMESYMCGIVYDYAFIHVPLA